MISVNKQNSAQNGTITIMGAGIDKTIIDLNGTQFLNINSGTSIVLINISIINGYSSNYGGAVYSFGDLTVDTVKFENNSAIRNGGAIYARNYFNLLNSIFENNYCTQTTSAGGSVYCLNKNIYGIIDNNRFINSYASRYGGSLYATNVNITNNEFINSTANGNNANGGGIYAEYVNFKNNTMVNCISASGNGNEIYVQGDVFNGILKILNNSTINISDTSFNLDATLTDDMGNSINGPSIQFYFNETLIGSGTSNNGIILGTFSKLLDNGIYSVTSNNNNLIIFNGTAIYEIDRTFSELYVSPTLGNDTIGNGSKNNPYASIKKAIIDGFNQGNFVILHLLEGNYTGMDNIQISLNNLGYLKIIGENKNVVIDGMDEKITSAFNFGNGLTVELENITFTRFNGNIFLLRLSSSNQNPRMIIKSCNFDKNNIITPFNIPNGELYDTKITNNIFSSQLGAFIKIDNLTYINNTGMMTPLIMMNNSEITNSIFKKIHQDTIMNLYKGFIQSYQQNSIINSINNTFEDNSRIFYSHETVTFTSINDTFINNTDNLGVIMYQIGNAEFTNAKFINNVATDNGNIFYHLNGILTLTNCTIEDNNINDDIYGMNPYGSRYSILLNSMNNLTFESIKTNNSRFQLKAFLNLNEFNIGGYNVNFYLNGSFIGNAPLINGVATDRKSVV